MSNIFHAIATEIATLEIDALERRQDTAFNFSSVHDFTKKIHQAAQYLSDDDADISLIDTNVHQHIADRLSSFLDTCHQIQSFDPTQGNPNETKNNLEASIREIHIQLLTTLLVPVQIMRMVKVLEETGFAQKLTNADAHVKELDDKLKQANNILQGIQKASGEAGFSAEANFFSEEANQQRKLSFRWLIFSALTVCLVGGLTVYVLTGIDVDAAAENLGVLVINNILSRLVPVSLGVLLLLLVVKNYYAAKHLQTLNKHRENCLRTFQTFASATDDKQVRDVILTQAVRFIFDPGSTGFVKDASTSMQGFDITKFATGVGQNLDD